MRRRHTRGGTERKNGEPRLGSLEAEPETRIGMHMVYCVCVCRGQGLFSGEAREGGKQDGAAGMWSLLESSLSLVHRELWQEPHHRPQLLTHLQSGGPALYPPGTWSDVRGAGRGTSLARGNSLRKRVVVSCSRQHSSSGHSASARRRGLGWGIPSIPCKGAGKDQEGTSRSAPDLFPGGVHVL